MTNDSEELSAAFRESVGGLILLKPLSPLRGAVADGEAIFSSQVSAQVALPADEIAVAPCFAQKYVEKQRELRVTIVGDDVFAVAIESQREPDAAVDWRRCADYRRLRHERAELDDDVRDRLMVLMSRLSLQYGAIDLIETPGGDTYFLEVNPTGQWLWVEELAGVPISRALAALLMRGRR